MPRISGTQVARRFEVFGDQGGVFADRIVVALFDGGGEPPVQLGAIRLELRFVGDRANQRMVEHILGLAGELHLIDELGRHQFGNHRFDAQHGEQVERRTATR